MQIKLKWKKEKYDVDVDLEEDPEAFRVTLLFLPNLAFAFLLVYHCSKPPPN